MEVGTDVRPEWLPFSGPKIYIIEVLRELNQLGLTAYSASEAMLVME